MMTLELREPKEKRRHGRRTQHPFPVLVESVTGIPTLFANPRTYHGRFNGDSVEIDSAEDIADLSSKGFFGKGSLSRGGAFPARGNKYPEMIRERQWMRRSEWASLLSDAAIEESVQNESHEPSGLGQCEGIAVPGPSGGDADGAVEDLPCHPEVTDMEIDHGSSVPVGTTGTSSPPRECSTEEEQQTRSDPGKPCEDDVGRDVIVLSDTDSENGDVIERRKPRMKKDKSEFQETLILLLEEALFLHYGLGCLEVLDISGETFLSSSELLNLCQQSNPRFVERYIAYHHFRSRGWVVKSGLKFGGDFLLYKEGPGIYHASYIVLVDVICEGVKSESLKWTTLMGLNRLAEASGKEVLLCHVVWPLNIPPKCIPSLDSIAEFKVHEVLLRRWQSSVARTDCEGEEEKS